MSYALAITLFTVSCPEALFYFLIDAEQEKKSIAASGFGWELNWSWHWEPLYCFPLIIHG